MKNKLKLLAFWMLMAFIGAATPSVVDHAKAAFYQWSKTASSNATADPTINWAEGMSPGSVNDSARAMMARAAEYRDDIGGSLVTSGTSTAYTVSTNQILPATPNNGQLLTIQAHATNGTAPTLRADGGTVYPIQMVAGTAVPSGTIVLGSRYQVSFSTSSNSWILLNLYASPSSLPIGGVLAYTGTTAPNSNFILAFGQCISRDTYAVYFALVGTTYGSCTDPNEFMVPDIRGRVIAGKDNMGGPSANRLTLDTTQGINGDGLGNTGGEQSHKIVTAEMPAHRHTITDPGHHHDVKLLTTSSGAGGSADIILHEAGHVGNDSYTTVGAGFGALSATTGITQTNLSTGGDGNHNNIQPTLILTYLIRVL